MNWGRSWPLALFAFAIGSREEAAHAICGTPPEVTVVPYRTFEAPLNVRVLLALDQSSEAEACKERGNAKCQRGAEPEIEIRSAPSIGRKRSTVAVTHRDWKSGSYSFTELLPVGALASHTAYEIWSLDRRGEASAKVLGSFTTGTQLDQTPPEWTGILKATMFRAVKAGMIRLSSECGEPRIRLEVAMPTDDMTAASALRAALWVAPAGAAIDFTSIPNVIEPIYPQGGHLAVIIAGTVEGDADDLPIIDGKSPWRIGVRIEDAAGNASSTSEAVVH